MARDFLSQAAQPAADTTIVSVASKATYAGATTSVASWFLSSEFGVLAGLVIGLTGLVISFHFQRRRDRREQTLHEAQLRELERE